MVGSILGTREDLAEVFAPHAAGHTVVTVEPRKLDGINEAGDDILVDCARAHLVIEY